MSTQSQENMIQEIADNMTHCRDVSGAGCTLLIGAGVSISAGIPAASGIVDIIKKRQKGAYQRAKKECEGDTPTYVECMERLAPSTQRDIIRECIEKAKINWAHIAIAQLIEAGYVDRILTTNFDPLVSRACGLINQFPAIYDFAMSNEIQEDKISSPAIFHLHGQQDGFTLINDEKSMKKLAKNLDPLLKNSSRKSMWLVAGYSGETDPVIDKLIALKKFDYPLFWAGYSPEPTGKIKDKLLKIPDTHFMGSQDADAFFISLARKLKCFPPNLIAKPYTHLLEVIDYINPFSQEDGKEVDIAALTKSKLKVHQKMDEPQLQASHDLQEGQFDKVIKRYEKSKKLLPAEKNILISAYYSKGLSLYPAIRLLTKNDQIEEWPLVAKYWEKIAKLDPKDAIAVSNWGNVLNDLGVASTGKQAEKYFKAACEKNAVATSLDSDYAPAFSNWGAVLDNLGRASAGEQAMEYFKAACEKYETAASRDPKLAAAFYNWGSTLDNLGRMSAGEQAVEYFKAACVKYEMAANLDPTDADAFSNWGAALDNLGRASAGVQAVEYFTAACVKLEMATHLDPKCTAAFDNWGNVLLRLAQMTEDRECEDYQTRAKENFLTVEELEPGTGSYNLACVWALDGKPSEAKKWLEKSLKHQKLPCVRHLNEDKDLDSLRDLNWFKALLKKVPKK